MPCASKQKGEAFFMVQGHSQASATWAQRANAGKRMRSKPPKTQPRHENEKKKTKELERSAQITA
eukprot:1469812-Prorocentrum_lima.AAC.1